ncbi:hypothetical protein [Streptomyces phaeolivaceus]|nr:hypothetical protein [Streptomyces phaeolivaceus]
MQPRTTRTRRRTRTPSETRASRPSINPSNAATRESTSSAGTPNPGN